MNRACHYPRYIAGLLILAANAYAGCAIERASQRPAPNQTQRTVGQIGLEVRRIDEKLVVVRALPGMPAEEAGFLAHDILTSVDGNSFTSVGSFIDYVSVRPGVHVNVEVMRNGRTLKVTVTPKAVVFPAGLDVYQRVGILLADGNKVTLAILLGTISNIAAADDDSRKEWREASRTSLYSNAEMLLIRSYQSEQGFRLVDRSKMEEITREYALQLSGLVPDEVRVKIGSMLGVTHIFQIDAVRWAKDGGTFDELVTRLIEVETGRVLAIDKELIPVK